MAETAVTGCKAAIAAAGPVLFPHHCLGCREEGRLLCSACLAMTKAPLRGFSVCPTCHAVSQAGVRCGRATCGKSALHAIVSMAPYREPLFRELVHAYKYEGIEEAGVVLRDLFSGFLRTQARAIRAVIPDDATVIPVPMHPLRFRSRGFNQTDVFAAAFAATVGGTVDGGLLQRSFTRKTQVEMGEHTDRRTNVSGAVRAVGPVPVSCVVIDDVVTTGSTLTACAEALRAAGACSVTAVTLLHG